MNETPHMQFDLPAALSELSEQRLKDMAEAGRSVRDMLRILTKSGQNMVGQCLANQGTFYELDHYPKGDVYDKETHSQFYYHAHRPEAGEHGHFHTFLRAAGMPKEVQPAPYSGKAKRPQGSDALTHFVAISMDRPGMPMGLFTTNRWVTDETFYKADDVISLIDRFSMELSYPCFATNTALTGLLKLFRPQIEALLVERDKTIAAWAASKPGSDVYEDRELEVTSQISINVDKQLKAVEAVLAARSAAA